MLRVRFLTRREALSSPPPFFLELSDLELLFLEEEREREALFFLSLFLSFFLDLERDLDSDELDDPEDEEGDLDLAITAL